jgi:hypothetical protein
VARATDVDHIDGRGPKGPRGHDWSNLRALCHSHHSKRTARDQPGGFSKGARATEPFVILAGRSGTGKTTVGVKLASRLGMAFMGPDDFDEGWTGLYDLLDYTDRAIVECVKIPYGLRRKMKERGATVIDLVASAEVRQQRLIDRGEPDENINWLLRPRGSLGYEEFIEPDIKLDASGTVDEAVDELAKSLSGLQTV